MFTERSRSASLLRYKAQLEKERMEIEHRFAQADAAQKIQDGHSAMMANVDSDYRVLPKRCMNDSTTEFMCSADHYYKVTTLSDGYRCTGFNTAKTMNWSGQSTQQGGSTVYHGTDATGKAFRKTCRASACFE